MKKNNKDKEALANRKSFETPMTNSYIRDILMIMDQYQRRLFLFILLEASQGLKGQRLDENFDVSKWKDYIMSINDKDFFEGLNWNTSIALEKIKELQGVVLDFSTKKRKTYISFISGFDYKDGIMTFKINEIVWAKLFDFAKGYGLVDIHLCLMLKRKQSLIMYRDIYKKDMLYFTEENFKKHYGLENKYARFRDIEKYFIIPAKEELDAISPRSFNYTIDYDTTKKGKPIKGITITGITHTENQPTAEIKRISAPAYRISPVIKKLFFEKFDFNQEEYERNRITISQAEAKMGTDKMDAFLRKIVPNALRAPDCVGYVITCLKRKMNTMDKKDTDQFLGNLFDGLAAQIAQSKHVK